LVAVETLQDVPFEVKRVYYIYNVEDGVRRGFHAHRKLNQALICIRGSCKVLLDDGGSREDVTLDDPAEGLFVGKMVWREMYDFSPDAVLLVLASEHYEVEDYIFDYEEFKRLVKKAEAEKR
jgi:dTDP-4-dehydrorhamnose 3,5-epimerase-like enzyme